MSKQDISAILLAGGSGRRFGGAVNKVLLPLGGKPVLLYSLDLLLAHPRVAELILVYRREDEAAVRQLAESCGSEKRLLTVPGGDTRQASVFEGLRSASSPYVLIHDAARPCLKASYVDACREAMEHFPAASVGVKAKDTVKLCDENGVVQQTTDRSRTWLVQTPQCFDRKLLEAAHIRLKGRPDMTDDCMLMEAEGYSVKMIEGDYGNLKITTPEDAALIRLPGSGE